MRDLADVNWVREQCVEMTAREGFAAALSAIRCRAPLRLKPEAIGLLLDPAHAAELTIKREDAAYGLGLDGIDDKRALARVIAERHIAAHPQPRANHYPDKAAPDAEGEPAPAHITPTGRMLLRSAPAWRYRPALFPDLRPRPAGRDTKQIYAKSTAARAPRRLVYAPRRRTSCNRAPIRSCWLTKSRS